MTSAVVTAAKQEVLHGGNASLKITAAKQEVLHGGVPHAKITAVRAEVLRSINTLVTLSHRRITVVVTGV
jgi:molybdopterin-biosynthesis enzyme MoeA-like protein